MDFSISKINVVPAQTPADLHKAVSDHGVSADRNTEAELINSISLEQTKEMTERIQGHLDRMSISLRFSTYGKYDEKISVTVYEKDTGKVIREIPPEEFQRLNEKMEELIGIIFNGNA